MSHVSKRRSKETKRRVFLVEDHPVTRRGLAQLLNCEPDLHVCGEEGAAAKARVRIPGLKPDLVIVDISLEGRSGLELIKDLTASCPRLPILVLSTHDEFLYAERALRAGARGYVMKQESMDHIMKAIRDVLRGELYLSEKARARLIHKTLNTGARLPVSDIELLSDRELEIFRLLGLGHSTSRIAAGLHLSVSTIETHRGHLKQKLKVPSAADLVRRAFEWVQSQDF